jgi:hypothetical protein
VALFIDRPLWSSRRVQSAVGSAEGGRLCLWWHLISDVSYAELHAESGHICLWSHLISDVSYGELHAFVARLGVPPRAFDRDHYDVPAELFDAAVSLGARPVGAQEIVQRLIGSGLRRRKRPARASGPSRALNLFDQ